jgi:beta-phosphoglucomutase family hydrolase
MLFICRLPAIQSLPSAALCGQLMLDIMAGLEDPADDRHITLGSGGEDTGPTPTPRLAGANSQSVGEQWQRAARGLGLSPQIRCCLFDLDGVVTRTAVQHAKAWKIMFDEFLMYYRRVSGMRFAPFEIGTDYIDYVDGKSRLDGTRSFLAARGILIPEGEPHDGPDTHSVYGLSNRKNALVLDLIATEGVTVFDDAVQYLQAVQAAGLPRAVVTSSANAEQVLTVTGLAEFFDLRVDAQVATTRRLGGKPAPDTFLAGAQLLGLEAKEAVVFEDSVAGVQAGRAGGFGLVVGVDRAGRAEQLRGNGADVVVRELTDLLEPP